MIKTFIIIGYLIFVLITYIILRFYNIKRNGDDPQAISLFLALFWPTIVIMFIMIYLGKGIDYVKNLY